MRARLVAPKILVQQISGRDLQAWCALITTVLRRMRPNVAPRLWPRPPAVNGRTSNRGRKSTVTRCQISLNNVGYRKPRARHHRWEK
jgi:hypothetical protein